MSCHGVMGRTTAMLFFFLQIFSSIVLLALRWVYIGCHLTLLGSTNADNMFWIKNLLSIFQDCMIHKSKHRYGPNFVVEKYKYSCTQIPCMKWLSECVCKNSGNTSYEKSLYEVTLVFLYEMVSFVLVLLR